VFVNFFLTFFSNSNIRGIRDDLQEAKRSTDSALQEVKHSQDKLDSIMNDVVVFKAYINNVQKRVQLADVQKTLEDEKNGTKVKLLKDSISALKESIQSDSLPPIDVK